MPLQLIQLTPVVRNAHHNIHFITHVFRAVTGQYQAVGHQPHGVADAGHVGTETGSRFAIHLQAPFNAIKAAVVFGVDISTLLQHLRSNRADRSFQIVGITAANL